MRDPLGQLRLRFAGLRLINTGARAEVYAGSDFTGRSVTVVVLTESASTDREVREAYRRAVAALEPELSALDPYVERPWAAFFDDPETVVGSVFAALGEPVPATGPAAEPAAEAATTRSEPEPEAAASPEAAPPDPGLTTAGTAADVGASGTAGASTGQPHPPVPPPPGGFVHPPVPPPPPGRPSRSPVPPPPGTAASARAPIAFPSPAVPRPRTGGRSRPGPGGPPEINVPRRVIVAVALGVALLICVCNALSNIG